MNEAIELATVRPERRLVVPRLDTDPEAKPRRTFVYSSDMASIDNDAASRGFIKLLERACAGIDDRWFLLPVSSADQKQDITAYRERVYCYELYHQVRLLSGEAEGVAAGAPEYTLSGEIDKAGLNAVIDGGREKPDLAWHVPGTFQNAAVLEVKTARSASHAGLVKDLKTLGAFLSAGTRAYSAGVLLLYGDSDRDQIHDRVLRAVDAAGVDRDVLKRARLMWHPAARSSLQDLGAIC